ncbi:hypothetical protein FOZ62_023223, partial [Perkinsus olseni]
MDANLADALKFEGTNFLLVMIGAVVRQVLDAILLALLPLGYIISRVWARMRLRTEPPGVVLITGAGGEGLGAMLALQYAGPSTRKLILTDIHRGSLEPVAEACRAKGTAEVVLVEADVCDAAAMAKLADDHPDVDLVIANAGVAAHTVSGASAAQPTPPVTESSANLLSINVLGVMNTILPFVDPMRQRRSGHLVIMSSMGSYLPTAASPEYHASKACVRVYGESLRVLLRGTGVNVTVICPGFVKTPMTDLAASRHVHPLPLVVSGEDAAMRCKRGIDANMAVVSFPSPLLWITETVMSWPSTVRELIIPCPPGTQASRLARLVP